MYERAVWAGTAIVLVGCIVVHEGDDDAPGGGEGEGEGEQQVLDLCLEAVEWVRDAGCQSEEDHCYEEQAFVDDSAGACLDEMTRWYDCVLDSALVDCDHDCEPGPSVECRVQYCEGNPGTDGCFGGGPGA